MRRMKNGYTFLTKKELAEVLKAKEVIIGDFGVFVKDSEVLNAKIDALNA